MSENKVMFNEIKDKLYNGHSFEECGIKVKNYIPISTKKLICEQIVLNSIDEVNGMKIFNPISHHLALHIVVIQSYTNLEGDYDDMYEYGIIDCLEKEIGKEYEFICDMVDNMIDNEIEIHNSLSGVINRNLQTLISKIPSDKEMSKLLNKIPKVLDKVSPETLGILKDIMGGKLDSPQPHPIQPNREQRRKAEKA